MFDDTPRNNDEVYKNSFIGHNTVQNDSTA